MRNHIVGDLSVLLRWVPWQLVESVCGTESFYCMWQTTHVAQMTHLPRWTCGLHGPWWNFNWGPTWTSIHMGWNINHFDVNVTVWSLVVTVRLCASSRATKSTYKSVSKRVIQLLARIAVLFAKHRWKRGRFCIHIMDFEHHIVKHDWRLLNSLLVWWVCVHSSPSRDSTWTWWFTIGSTSSICALFLRFQHLHCWNLHKDKACSHLHLLRMNVFDRRTLLSAELARGLESEIGGRSFQCSWAKQMKIVLLNASHVRTHFEMLQRLYVCFWFYFLLVLVTSEETAFPCWAQILSNSGAETFQWCRSFVINDGSCCCSNSWLNGSLCKVVCVKEAVVLAKWLESITLHVAQQNPDDEHAQLLA